MVSVKKAFFALSITSLLITSGSLLTMQPAKAMDESNSQFAAMPGDPSSLTIDSKLQTTDEKVTKSQQTTPEKPNTRQPLKLSTTESTQPRNCCQTSLDFVKENPGFTAALTIDALGQVADIGQLAYAAGKDIFPNEFYQAEALAETAVTLVNLGRYLRENCSCTCAQDKLKQTCSACARCKNSIKPCNKRSGAQRRKRKKEATTLNAQQAETTQQQRMSTSTLPSVQPVVADEHIIMFENPLSPVTIASPSQPQLPKTHKHKKKKLSKLPQTEQPAMELADLRAQPTEQEKTQAPGYWDRFKDFLQESPYYAVAATNATLCQISALSTLSGWAFGQDYEVSEDVYTAQSVFTTTLNCLALTTLTAKYGRLKYHAWKRAKLEAAEKAANAQENV